LPRSSSRSSQAADSPPTGEHPACQGRPKRKVEHASGDGKADLLHAIYDRITVAGQEIVGVRLTQAAYAHGLALALPEEVEMARPTGVGSALTAYGMPIEGRDEWLAAVARLLA
jgi:hypothetical protein